VKDLAGASALAIAGGALWAAEGDLVRVDLTTGRAHLVQSGAFAGLASAGGTVWSAAYLGHRPRGAATGADTRAGVVAEFSSGGALVGAVNTGTVMGNGVSALAVDPSGTAWTVSDFNSMVSRITPKASSPAPP
jgi:hypothetical protein